jgi:hypothetical protein
LTGSNQGTDTFQRVLRQSIETRINAVRHKLSLAHSFCTTLEMQVQCGRIEQAKQQLRKLRAVIEGLAAHIRGSPHIRPELMDDFEKQIVLLRRRLALLDSMVSHRSESASDSPPTRH